MSSEETSDRYLDRLLSRIDELPAGAKDETALESTALEDFEVLGELGRGGMGVVYAARQKSSGRLVALKFLPVHLSMSESSRERFRREAAAIARLSHAHLVRLNAIGEKDGAPFLAMEFVSGVTLSTLLQKVWRRNPASLQGPDLYRALREGWQERHAKIALAAGLRTPPELPESIFWMQSYSKIFAHWAWQIAEALASAHDSQVLHRDVKPSNVLITASGDALLVDFGLAWESGAESMTKSEEFVGTLYYAAPEALLGKEGQRSPSSDIYSLGMVLYESLALHNPFDADSRSQAIHRIVTHDPAPVRRLNPEVSKELELVCMTAIQKEPRWRYESAAAFASDLWRSQHQEPILAHSLGAWTQSLRRLRRRPLPALGVALALAALVAGSVLWKPREAATTVGSGQTPPSSTQAPKEPSPKELVAPPPAPVAPAPAKPQLPIISQSERQLADGAGFFVARLFGPAREALSKALTADSDNLNARILLAANYAQIRNYAEASAMLLPALTKRPDSQALLSLQSWILQQLGKAAEAAPLSRKPQRDYPDAAEEVARAALLVLQGDPAGAETVLARVSSVDPQAVWHLLPRGIILAFEDSQRSLALLEEFERRAPRDPLAITSLGFLWHKVGDYEKAESCFRFALEIEPGFDYAVLGMSKIPKKK